MKTEEQEVIDKIIATTTQIQEKYPELSKFLGEMPITIPNENNPKINISILKEYSESLIQILKKYQFEHSLS